MNIDRYSAPYHRSDNTPDEPKHITVFAATGLRNYHAKGCVHIYLNRQGYDSYKIHSRRWSHYDGQLSISLIHACLANPLQFPGGAPVSTQSRIDVGTGEAGGIGGQQPDNTEARPDANNTLTGFKAPRMTEKKIPRSTLRGRKPSPVMVHGNVEWEVESIVNSQIKGERLQYQARWKDFGDDSNWYLAQCFKNAPDRLREFHVANPNHPGPPVRLPEWTRAFLECRADPVHLDDNLAWP